MYLAKVLLLACFHDVGVCEVFFRLLVKGSVRVAVEVPCSSSKRHRLCARSWRCHHDITIIATTAAFCSTIMGGKSSKEAAPAATSDGSAPVTESGVVLAIDLQSK